MDFARVAWARFSGDTGFKVLGRERVGGFEVLTAWLGTDQVSALDGGPPSAFGTITYEHAAGVLDSSTEQFSATAEPAMRVPASSANSR